MIYVIHPDVRNYMAYVLDSKEARRVLGPDTTFHFDQRPVSWREQWHPMPISFAKVTGVRKAAMPDLMIRNGRLFLSEKAHSVLQDLLTPCGEWLPVDVNGNTGYLFNILALADSVDGLDPRLCSKNTFGELQSLGFIENKVGTFPVFRTAFDDYMGAYCNDAFKRAVENAKLGGVVFSADLGNIFPPDSSATKPKPH